MTHRRVGARLALTVVVVVALVGVFVVRLVDVQVIRAEALVAAADDSRIVSLTTYGTRGSIVASDGTVLAQSVDRFDITASPRQADLDQTELKREGTWTRVPTTEAIAELARITGTPAADILSALTADPDSQFAYLARGVTLDVYRQVAALDIPWVYAQVHPSRSYPLGAVAGNLVGFIGTDGPQAGTEANDDDCLAATDGTTTYESSADGVRLPGTEVVDTAAEDGGTIRLTIDADLQWYAQQVLDREARRLGAEWAVAMVVEVKTGRILTAADWPSVDPNDVDLVQDNAWGARTFSSPYEPGSIMKPFTVASELDAGVIAPTTQWAVPYHYTQGLPGDAYIQDAWWHGTMQWTTAGVLVNSSNVGLAQMSEKMSSAERRDYLLRFGFDQTTEVGFWGESSGLVLPLDEVDAITDRTQGFGQGISVTAAQMASAYQALGNHGVRMPLTLVDGCEHPDGTVTDAPQGEGTRVVGADAADTTVAMLEQVPTVVLDGVAIPGYRIAAKTGTAEVAEGGVYTDDRIISVAGLLPAEDPEYAVVVSFAKPDTIKTSAGTAPAFADLTKQIIKEFRIPPSAGSTPEIPLTW